MKKIIFLLFTIGTLLLVDRAYAAFAAVQEATQVSGTTATLTIALSATQQYNLVVIPIRLGSKTETCDSVTDNKGNTYVITSVLDGTGATLRAYMAYGVQTIGGVTEITVTFSGAVASKRVGADEFSGGAHTNAAVYDTIATGNNSGTNLSVSLTPSASGKLIYAMGTQTTATWTAGAGYTLYSGASSSTQGQYKLSGTTSETAPLTSNQSAEWLEIAISFNPHVVKQTIIY